MSFKIKQKSKHSNSAKNLIKTDDLKNKKHIQKLSSLSDIKQGISKNIQFNSLLKNSLSGNEFCPKCLSDMEYGKTICKHCGFSFKSVGYTPDDFKIMKEFIQFVKSHDKLKNESIKLLNRDVDEDSLVYGLLEEIYFDDFLKNQYQNSVLNDFVDLDELFDSDEANCFTTKTLDYKYSLNPKVDEVNVSIDYYQYKLLLDVESYNDLDLALLNTPHFLKSPLKSLALKEKYITHHASKANWFDFSKSLKTEDLKEFLKKHNLNDNGSREDLILRIYNSNLSLDEFESDKHYLTQKAYNYLANNEWICFFIEFLYNFDFSDFLDFFAEGEIHEIAVKYLNQHIELAKYNLDFDYLNKSLIAEAKLNDALENYENALMWEMQIFCLNINPICLKMEDFPSFRPLNEDNINNLRKFKEMFGDEYFLKEFNKNWNFLDFNSYVVSKNEAFEILNNALNSIDLSEDNKFVKDEYFEKFY